LHAVVDLGALATDFMDFGHNVSFNKNPLKAGSVMPMAGVNKPPGHKPKWQKVKNPPKRVVRYKRD
jgi:hypothetical protein